MILCEREESKTIPFPRHALELERPPHLIQPTYSSRGICNVEFDAYVQFVEQILRKLLPQELVIALSTSRNPEAIRRGIQGLNEKLPLLAWNDPRKAPCTLC